MKRQSAKGKGKDIFFAEPKPQENAVTPSQQHNGAEVQRQNGTELKRQNSRTAKEQPTKLTSWVPESLAEELDQYWISLRAKDRKVTKSSIVVEALRNYLEKAD